MMRVQRDVQRLLLIFAVVCPATEAIAARTLYVATTGSDSNDGLSLQSPLASLGRAHQLVNIPAYGDHTILVRGGTYRGESVVWTKHSPDYDVTIAAYQNEVPIFDGIENGQMAPRFIHVAQGTGACSNVTIRGLTVRHYLHHGILLGAEAANWHGCNTIENNVFEENGDLYLPQGYQCNSELTGFGTIDLINSRNNVIRNNVMVKNEDCAQNAAHMHALYLAHGSSNNDVYGNYISMTSGDPIRVRDASNDNYFHDNYVDRSGAYGFVSGWRDTTEGEQLSSGNIIEDNVFTFPYPAADPIDLICTGAGGVCDNSTFVDNGQRFVYTDHAYEDLGGMISGDFDGDQDSELVLATNYVTNDSARNFLFSKVVRSNGGPDRHLRKVLYIASHHSVRGMTAGDYDGNGVDEILTYFKRISNNQTRVYKGNGTTSLTGSEIYSSSYYDILALTSGDLNGDGNDEVVTSFYPTAGAGQNVLYRGNGATSLLTHGKLYSTTSWKITSLTTGDFDSGGGDELLSAFHTSSTARIYKGNGTSSAINLGYIYSTPHWTIESLAAGHYSSSTTPTLVTGLRHRNVSLTEMYHGDDSNVLQTMLYDSPHWRVSALAAGEFATASNEELVTAFVLPTTTQVWAGNGATSWSSFGTFHRWPY